MPKLTVRGKNPEDGGGWKPLPSGSYDIQLDSIEETTSRRGNQQLKVAGHVVDGPHDQKKVTIWYALTESALWKLQNLAEAAGVDYEVAELDDTDPETGKPFVEMDLDTDDLVGCIVTYDVTEYKHEGKDQNRFENERGPEGAEKAGSSSGGVAGGGDDGDDDSSDESADGGESEAEAAPAARGRRTRRART